MIKIDTLKLQKSDNLINEDNPSYSSILVGESSGDIWVDNIDNPTLAIVYSYSVGGYAIMGNPKEDYTIQKLYYFLIKELLPTFTDINEFNFSVESGEVKEKLFSLFSGKEINTEVEYYFRATERIKRNSPLPPEYTISIVDKKIIDKTDIREIKNKEMLNNRILESWKSYDDFFEKSIAYVILYKNSIEAVIIGTARYNNIITIDIETNEKHQKKGLASILTEKFLDKCKEKKLVAQWNCIASNIASKRTAENAGFKLLKKDSYHWLN